MTAWFLSTKNRFTNEDWVLIHKEARGRSQSVKHEMFFENQNKQRGGRCLWEYRIIVSLLLNLAMQIKEADQRFY